MSVRPVEVDVPHTLGRAAARARVEAGIRRIGDLVPGGHVADQQWEGDRLTFTIAAFGQRIASRIQVGDTHVHVEIDLPAMFALFAGPIRAKLAREGQTMLA